VVYPPGLGGVPQKGTPPGVFSDENLAALSANASGELDVLGHDGHSLGVDGAEVGVFEEGHQVGLGGFLESDNRGSLETKVVLEILSDFSNESLERQLAHQKFGGLLVATDLSKGDGSRSVSVWLLDPAGRRRALSGGLGGELLTRGFASGRLTGGLLGTSHLVLLGSCEVFLVVDY